MRISDWSSDVCSSDLEKFPELIEQHVGTLDEGIGDKRTSAQVPVRKAIEQIERMLEIGRASCRESVSVRVDLGGSRLIKKKKNGVRKLHGLYKQHRE